MIEIAIILLINILFYSKTITYKYVSDDARIAREPKHKNKWVHWFRVFTGYARSTEQVDHLLTIIFHSLVCVGIYLAFGANQISFWAAVLFSFNPINNQGSVWIAGRPYVFPTLALLWSITIPILSPFFLFMGSQYTLGVVAPIILFGINPMLCLSIPFLWFIRARRFKSDVTNKINTQSFTEDKRIHFKKVILAIKTFGFYLTHAIIPIKTTFYHSYLQSSCTSMRYKAYKMDRFFWIGLAAIVGIAFYWLCFTWNLISFALLWWCIGIAPFLNFYRMNQEIAERYVYLPNVGIMFVLASILPINLLWLFAGMYATKMWFYMDAYTDEFYINEYASMNSPDSWYAWHIRGHLRWQVGSLPETIIMWTMARRINPKEFKILFNLAVCCMVIKRKEEALEWLKLAEQNIPEGQEEDSAKFIDEFRTGKHYPILL